MTKYHTGHRWGMLTLIERTGNQALVKCDCGKVTTFFMPHLISANKRDCGCMKGKTSLVYFIQVHDFVKIGHTVSLGARLAYVQTNCPYKVSLIRVIPLAGPETERWLHSYFQSEWQHGEWFKFTDEMLAIIPPPE